MKYFCTKIYIAMFVGLSATALHSTDNNLSQVLLDVNSATKTATTLPFSQCVLDFTDANTSLTSAATLGMHLVADNATGTLGLTDASYCIMENRLHILKDLWCGFLGFLKIPLRFNFLHSTFF